MVRAVRPPLPSPLATLGIARDVRPPFSLPHHCLVAAPRALCVRRPPNASTLAHRLLAQVHENKDERERRFTETVEKVVRRGGRCLVPVFALGRAQELLLILDELWAAHPELQHIPIFFSSRLASRSLEVRPGGSGAEPCAGVWGGGGC